MRYAIAMALLVVSAYSYAQSPQLREYAEQLKQDAAAGRITYAQRSDLMRDGLARENGGLNAFDQEYWAYHAMLSAEMDAGRMTWPQFNYAMTTKRNELFERQRQQALQITPPLQSPGPRINPRTGMPYKPSSRTECRPDFRGGFVCDNY